MRDRARCARRTRARRVQDLAARRLAGIAAELAGRLVDGEPCPVCGSAEHPAPRGRAPMPVTEEEQADRRGGLRRRAARRCWPPTRQRAPRSTPRRGCEQRAGGLGRRRGVGAAPRAAGAVPGRRGRGCRDADARREPVAALERGGHPARRGGRTASTPRIATAESAPRHARRQLVRPGTRRGHRACVGDDAADDLRGPGRAGSARSLERLRPRGPPSSRTSGPPSGRGAGEVSAPSTTAAEHGLRDRRRASGAAVLTEAERAAAGQRGARARRGRRRARAAALDDPDVRAVGGRGRPGPDRAQEALAAAAEAAATRGARAATTCRTSASTALAGLRQRLVDGPRGAGRRCATEYLRAEAMSRLVRGMGSDNQLQMRLSSYVLATRLDQVLDAANERLGADARPALPAAAHRPGRRKGAQAGLGLEVLDQWTGDVREPSTLSGGETFVVSLSLALGLADVVTQEAGGTEIETLFVDEGFGTLDADTLDDVMDRLDELRAGGRTVGRGQPRERAAHPHPHPAARRTSHREGSTVRRRDAGRLSVTAPAERMLAVVDIDGVLADVRHRLHHVAHAAEGLARVLRRRARGPAARGGRPGRRGRWPRCYESSTSPDVPRTAGPTPSPGSRATTCPTASSPAAPRRPPARPVLQGRGAAPASPEPGSVAVLVDDDPMVLRGRPRRRVRRAPGDLDGRAAGPARGAGGSTARPEAAGPRRRIRYAAAA